MAKVVLFFLTIVWSVSFCLPGWSAEVNDPQVALVRGFESDNERIGGLRLKQPEKELEKAISCRPEKGKEIFEGATGEYVQAWKYPGCGIVLKMGSGRRGGAKMVEAITITAPSDLATSRGARIGSTEEEVAGAYGPFRDRESSKKGKVFVAGSVYDGIIFRFKSGKVIEIFLGAAAE